MPVPTGPGSFALSLKAFSDKVGKNAKAVFKKVVFDMYVDIAMLTPVDTGRARGGWQVGGSVGGGETGLDPTPTGTENRSAAPLQALRGVSDLGNVVYIYNNVVYIVPLEYGHSQDKAPHGMVRVTIAKFNQFIEKAVWEFK